MSSTLTFSVSNRKPKNGQMMRCVEYPGGEVDIRLVVDESLDCGASVRELRVKGLWLLRCSRFLGRKWGLPPMACEAESPLLAAAKNYIHKINAGVDLEARTYALAALSDAVKTASRPQKEQTNGHNP